MSPRDVLTAAVAALLVALVVLVVFLHGRQQRGAAAIAASLAERFGVTRVRSGLITTEIALERPGWSGHLRAHARPRSAFEVLQFTGTTRAPRSAWSLASPWLAQVEGPGQRVALESPALRDRFVVFAERPAELRAFFDADVERLLVDLDAGVSHALIGATPGIAVSVIGTQLSVMVIGQQLEDREHLERALALIERVAEHRPA